MAIFKIIPFIRKYFITERKGWKYHQGIGTWCHNASVNTMKAVPCLCAQPILRRFHWSYSPSKCPTQGCTCCWSTQDLWINTRNYILALKLLSIQWHVCAKPPNRSQNIKEKWQTGFSGNNCIKLENFPLVDIYITVCFNISYSFIPE